MVVLRAATGSRSLTLSEPQPSTDEHANPGQIDAVTARLEVPGLEAELQVALDGDVGLALLFRDMARDWQGWQGVRAWQSPLDHLRLACTADGRGHVRVSLRLHQDGREAWVAEAELDLEAGQLERLSAQLGRLLNNVPA
jgi:hypothetical protein